MMPDDEDTANNRLRPAETILRRPALHPKPTPAPREYPAMKTLLTPIRTTVVAVLTLRLLIPAASANAGTGFTNINAGLTGVYGGSVAWGDYDNDGRLDILLTGSLDSGIPISRVYHNNGGGTFALNTNAELRGVAFGSVAWGDYDNDGRLDILLTGLTESGDIISQVYHNDGDGAFSLNTNAALQGVYYSSVAWGDYDNDGRLDILLTGMMNSGDYVSQVYHNNGDGTFTLNTNAVLQGVAFGSVAWGDYDNDGRLDILLTGSTGQIDTNGNPIPFSGIYRNNGDGTFTLNTNAMLPGVYESSVAWGDYDNDGRLDILLTGCTGYDTNGNTMLLSSVYRNNWDGTFTLNTNAGLPGIEYSSVAWGDYDNEGRLDILLTGVLSDGDGVAQVYQNNGDGTFTRNTNAVLPAVSSGSVAWGDYDNEGRLDILLTGDTGTVDTNGNEIDISSVYRNLSPITNTPPTAPTGLTATVSSNWVSLAWTAATDAQTPAAALTYNLRVGTTPGGSDLVSPESDPATGMRRLPQMGNAQEGTHAIVDVSTLPFGSVCYWSVQAVDSAWAGSPFAPEGVFMAPVGSPIATTLPAGSISVSGATLNGTVNPDGLAATGWFQWGTDTNYGNFFSAESFPATNAGLGISAEPNNLTPGWTYHFRLVAANKAGTNYGADLVFQTCGGTNFVTTLADSGVGSLRQTIAASRVSDVIEFATNGTVTLTSGELLITNSLTIIGPGATNLILSGNGSSRVFDINNSNATVSISSLTVCDGQATNGANGTSISSPNGGMGADGGGIYNLGNLTVSYCNVTGNAAGSGGYGFSAGGYGGNGGNGGGIYSAGALWLTATTLSANTAGNCGGAGGNAGINGSYGGNGGGIYSVGALVLNTCTLSANAAGSGGHGGDNAAYLGGAGGVGGYGGGVCSGGALTVTACTITANSAGTGGYGGGCFNLTGHGGQGGPGGDGGGIYSSSGAASATLCNALIALNSVGNGQNGGVAGTPSNIGLPGADGSGPELCGAFTSLGYNLVRVADSAAALVNEADSDLVGSAAAAIDPVIGSLANNGGPTPTVALLPGSPAIDAGDDSQTGTDQRGFPRKSGAHVDIGAFELQIFGLSAPAVTSGTGALSVNPATGLCSLDLSCAVNPNGLPTTAFIQYGLTPNYGAASTPVPVGFGLTAVSTNLWLTGLEPGVTYHYCAAATSDAGTNCGPDQSVITTPAVTLPAVAITAIQATLRGAVNPNGLETLAWFEWGATTNYGAFTAVSTLSGGSQLLPLSAAITGLQPGATYHYRTDSYNDLGLAQGVDQTFTTANLAAAITGCTLTAAGHFQFQFTGSAASTYTVLCSTNLALPLNNWAQVGAVTNIAPGQYQFTDPGTKTNQPERFYLLRQP
jgi:hypothetical protein